MRSSIRAIGSHGSQLGIFSHNEVFPQSTGRFGGYPSATSLAILYINMIGSLRRDGGSAGFADGFSGDLIEDAC